MDSASISLQTIAWMSSPLNTRNRNERLLAALRYFCAERDEVRPMENGPKGMGWSTVHDLEEAGLIELVGVGSSIRKRPYRTTKAGRTVLASDMPETLLPAFRSYDDRRNARPAATTVPFEPTPPVAIPNTRADADAKPSTLRGRPPGRKPSESHPPFVPQAQITAILKAAKDEGASVEIRFEKDCVRFALVPTGGISEDPV